MIGKIRSVGDWQNLRTAIQLLLFFLVANTFWIISSFASSNYDHYYICDATGAILTENDMKGHTITVNIRYWHENHNKDTEGWVETTETFQYNNGKGYAGIYSTFSKPWATSGINSKSKSSDGFPNYNTHYSSVSESMCNTLNSRIRAQYGTDTSKYTGHIWTCVDGQSNYWEGNIRTYNWSVTSFYIDGKQVSWTPQWIGFWGYKSHSNGTNRHDNYIVKQSIIGHSHSDSNNDGACDSCGEVYRTRYHLDVNGVLNGSSSGNLGSYGTANVWVDGRSTESGINDYYQWVVPGTKYSISAKANSGYTYLGVASGNLSGTMPNSDYGVYLKFGSNYTINFNGNGATSGSTALQSRVYSDGTKALTANGFSRIGYTFTGWNTAANGSGMSYSNGQWVNNLTSTANGTVTLYAQWKANTYTLTINPNGGTLNVSDGTITKNSDGTAKATVRYDGTDYYALGVTASRSHYIMDGFYTAASGGTKLWDNGGICYNGNAYWNSSNNWCYAGDVTVYAHWKDAPGYHNGQAIVYTITYNLFPKNGNGVKITNPGNPTTYTIETPTFTLKNPSAANYSFEGWYGSGTKGSKGITIVQGSIGDLHFTADWWPTKDTNKSSGKDQNLPYVKTTDIVENNYKLAS